MLLQPRNNHPHLETLRCGHELIGWTLVSSGSFLVFLLESFPDRITNAAVSFLDPWDLDEGFRYYRLKP
jgi:hypothetical protein